MELDTQADTPDTLKLSVSADGKIYRDLNCTETIQSFTANGGNSPYVEVTFAGEINGRERYLKVDFDGRAWVDRIEIECE